MKETLCRGAVNVCGGLVVGGTAPAALWKASMARSMPAAAERSWRAPIWVYRAPMLKSTLPFSNASVRWQDGTPVRESYLVKDTAEGVQFLPSLSLHCSLSPMTQGV